MTGGTVPGGAVEGKKGPPERRWSSGETPVPGDPDPGRRNNQAFNANKRPHGRHPEMRRSAAAGRTQTPMRTPPGKPRIRPMDHCTFSSQETQN